MPGGLTGIELAATARRARPTLPIVLATGRPDALNPLTMRETGMVYLRKPYRPSDLLAILRRLLAPPKPALKA